MKTGRSILLAGVLGVAALCNQEDAAPAVRGERSLETGSHELAPKKPSSPRPGVPSLPTRKHTAQAISAVLEDSEDTDSSEELGAPTALDLYWDDLEKELNAYGVGFSFSGGWFVTEEFLFRVEEGGNGEALFTAQRRSFPYPMTVIRSHAPTPEELLDLVLNPEPVPANEVGDTGEF